MHVDDEDTRHRSVGNLGAASSLGPDDAFLRALLQHQSATDALGAAIVARDPVAVEIAAADAFSFLLTARAALRRLESAVDPDLARIQSAKYGVRTNQRALLDLLDRATAQLAVPELHSALGQLRASLAPTDGERTHEERFRR